MKTLLKITVLLLLSATSFSQNAYFDALYYANNKNELESMIDSIGNNYEGNNLRKSDSTELKTLKAFLNNPKKDSVPDIVKVKDILKRYSFLSNGNNVSSFSMAPFVTPPLVGLLASLPFASNDSLQGLYSFVMKNLKEHHQTNVQHILYKNIEKFEDTKALFPKTYEKLLESKAINTSNFGANMKEAMSSDFHTFLDSAFSYIDHPKDSNKNAFFTKQRIDNIRNDSNYKTTKMAFKIMKDMYDGVDLFEILKAYVLNEKEYESPKEILPRFKEVLVLERNLRDTTSKGKNTGTWLSLSKLALIDNVNEKKYFIALLHSQSQDSWLTENKEYDSLFKSKILPLQLSLIRAESNIKQKEGSLSSKELFKIKHILFIDLLEIYKVPPKVISNARHLGNIFQTYYTNDYENFMLEFAGILKNLSAVYENENIYETLRRIEDISGLSASFIKAKDASEIKEILGEYNKVNAFQKQKNKITFSISSTPGFHYYVPRKLMKDKARGKIDDKAEEFSLSIPIGLSSSLKVHNYGTLNASYNVLDLGNFIPYTTNADKEESFDINKFIIQEFTASWSFYNWPLNISLGTRRVPHTQTFVKDGSPYASEYKRGFFIRVGYDIPLVFFGKWRSLPSSNVFKKRTKNL